MQKGLFRHEILFAPERLFAFNFDNSASVESARETE